MTPAHRARRPALALALGSLVTAAVAWYGEIRTPDPTAMAMPLSPWPVNVASSWPKMPDACFTGATSLQQWHLWYSDFPHGGNTVVVNRSGWPCLAMRHTEISQSMMGNCQFYETDGLRLPDAWQRPYEPIVVPL